MKLNQVIARDGADSRIFGIAGIRRLGAIDDLAEFALANLIGIVIPARNRASLVHFGQFDLVRIRRDAEGLRPEPQGPSPCTRLTYSYNRFRRAGRFQFGCRADPFKLFVDLIARPFGASGAHNLAAHLGKTNLVCLFRYDPQLIRAEAVTVGREWSSANKSASHLAGSAYRLWEYSTGSGWETAK